MRAVSKGDDGEIKAILSELDSGEHKKAPEIMTGVASVEERIKERLVKLGYKVELNLGNNNNRISLAVYDEKTDKYLVGVELDRDAFLSSDSCLERDVYKPRFLESRGWTLLRVWCRDWWLSPQKVIKSIVNAAERNK